MLPRRVLFVNRPETYTVPGGDTVLMEKTRAYLEGQGIQVDVCLDPEPDATGYDLAHLFNMQLPDDELRQLRSLKRSGVPVVLTPLYWSMAELNWGSAALDHAFTLPAADRTAFLQGVADRTLLVHGVPWHSYLSAAQCATQRAIAEGADILLPNSVSEVRQLQHTLGTRQFAFHVVPVGVTPGVFHGARPDLFVQRHGLRDFVLMVARWDRRKNVLMLLEAMRGLDLPLVLVGQRPHPDYEQLARPLLPPGTLLLEGLTEVELASAYAAARVHVLPSWFEQPGLSSLEAALAGCSIVVGNRGAELDYFGDGAYYCDPASAPSIREALLAAWRDHPTDVARRRVLQERIAREYTWVRTGAETLVAYGRVLGGDQRRSASPAVPAPVREESEMRILFVGRPDLFQKPGQDTILVEKYRRALLKRGIAVELSLDLRPEAGTFDLVHLLGVQDPFMGLLPCHTVKRRGLPLALSPMYGEPPELEPYPGFLEQQRTLVELADRLMPVDPDELRRMEVRLGRHGKPCTLIDEASPEDRLAALLIEAYRALIADPDAHRPKERASERVQVGVMSLEHPDYACARIRLLDPLSALGEDVSCRWVISRGPDGAPIAHEAALVDVDVVVIQRTFPRAENWPLIERVLGSGKRIVFEFDDLLFDMPPSNWNHAPAEASKPFMLEMAARAHEVTVSTPALAEAIAPYAREVRVLPNLLDHRLWALDRPLLEPGKVVTIGYAGTREHVSDLGMVEEALLAIAERFAGRVRFKFLGCGSERLAGHPAYSFVRFEPGYANYARKLQEAGIDIAVAPLEDNRFNRAKSHIKWLEYAACGIAGIFADLEPYRDHVRHGETGLLVSGGVAEWTDAIAELVADASKRRAIAEAARREVAERHTLATGLAPYRALYGPEGFHAEGKHKVSIVIPVFNKVEYTMRCLEALVATTPPDLYEVIVVDNASSDGTREFLAQLGGDLQIITNEVNLGFAKACNQGARAARGKSLVFLNNDTIPQHGWLEALLREVETDPTVGAVAGKLLYPQNGTIQHAGVGWRTLPGPIHGPYLYFRCWPAEAPEVNWRRDLDMVTAACMLVPRQLFEQVGGFDEGYVNGMEDCDLCLLIRQAGYRVRYTPHSVVYHHESISDGRADHDHPNFMYFLSKWQGKLSVPDEALMLPNGAPANPRYGCIEPVPTRRVSIVIPLYNKVDYTRRCLEALAANTPEDLYEVILVDNASTDGTGELLGSLRGDVTIIRNPHNLGFAMACNQGARAAASEFVVFLNNDTEPQSGWLEALLAEIESDPRVGIVGCKLLYPGTGRIQHAGIGWIDGFPDHPHRNAPADAPEVNAARDLDMVTGACMLVRRQLFEQVGGFDEGYLNGVEDVDLCLQVRRAGFRVRYCPGSVLIHHEGTSEGRFSHVGPNLRRFFGRWATSLGPAQELLDRPGPIPVRWEGSQFLYHSLALVNRELCKRLIASGNVDLEVVPYELSQFGPGNDLGFRAIAQRMGRELPAPAAVHVRHQWPPHFEPPEQGAWVLIQPWEFGAAPLEWVAPMRDRIDEIWVPSSWVKQSYVASGVPADKIVVVPNGVDTARYCPEGPRHPLATGKRFKFLYVGGAIVRKGIDILLETYASTFTRQDDVCLVIKGNGRGTHYRKNSLDEQIRALAADPGGPEIEYLDEELDDEGVASVYRACDALVHPYRGEGFGLPIAEAMASGLPVIVTGHGACLDFCDERTAYLIPARDVPVDDPGGRGLPPSSAEYRWAEPDRDGLSALMRKVTADPAAAREVGSRGRERIAAAFTWDHAAALVEERLRVLAERRPLRFGPTEPFHPDVLPLPLEGRRSKLWLHVVDWRSEAWREIVKIYARATGPDDDQTLALWLDPAQGISQEEAAEGIMGVLAEQGIDPDRSPDLMLLTDRLDEFELGRLFAAADAIVALDDGVQVERARKAGRRAVRALSELEGKPCASSS